VNNDWLDINVLEDYLDGKLDAKTMNRVEREALEDPFVAEALAGLSAAPKRALSNLSLLQKQLQERVAEEQVAKKGRVITWQRLSIAATAAVLFIAVSIIFWMKDTANRKQQLAGQAKQVDVNIAPKLEQDTLDALPSDPMLAKVLPKSDVVKSPSAEAAVDEAVMDMRENAYAANIQRNAPVTVADSVNPQLNDVEIRGYSALKKQAITAAATRIADSESSIPLKANLNGKVLDEETGEPMQGVMVNLAGTNQGVMTNQKGEFHLAAPELLASSKIVATAIGYKNQEAPVLLGETMEIRMKGDAQTLSEVVVVKSNSKAKDTTVVGALNGRVAGVTVRSRAKEMISNPIGGWAKWESYLKANNGLKEQKSSDAQVGLTFVVDAKGQPSDVQVQKSVDAEHDTEAKRLLRNGPKWSQPKVHGSRMTVYISF